MLQPYPDKLYIFTPNSTIRILMQGILLIRIYYKLLVPKIAQESYITKDIWWKNKCFYLIFATII